MFPEDKPITTENERLDNGSLVMAETDPNDPQVEELIPEAAEQNRYDREEMIRQALRQKYKTSIFYLAAMSSSAAFLIGSVDAFVNYMNSNDGEDLVQAVSIKAILELGSFAFFFPIKLITSTFCAISLKENIQEILALRRLLQSNENLQTSDLVLEDVNGAFEPTQDINTNTSGNEPENTTIYNGSVIELRDALEDGMRVNESGTAHGYNQEVDSALIPIENTNQTYQSIFEKGKTLATSIFSSFANLNITFRGFTRVTDPQLLESEQNRLS